MPQFEQKKPIGTPPTKPYKPEYAEMLVDHMSQMFSFESFGGVIGCGRQQLYKWAELHADFADAKKIGKEKSLLEHERLLNSGAKGLVENYNPASLFFGMKNRLGWADKQEIDQKVESQNINLNAQVDLQKLSDDEIDLLGKLVEKMGGASAKN